jgi:dTDP-L-rhamnose 4-epimerase
MRRVIDDVTDIARANLAAIERVRPPGTLSAYNIATGQPHTILEMATALADAMGGPAPEVTGGASRGGDVRHITATPALAHKELGFHAEVSFTDGIKEFAIAPLRS